VVGYSIFVLRDDGAVADIVYHVPLATYQAYNPWGGKSLYDWASIGGRAYKVSFDRPYYNWAGAGDFFDGDYNMIRWLEAQGYTIAYVTSLDLHTSPDVFANRKLFVSNWHDEYWSRPMRENVTAARDQGKHLAFFSSNNVYWQVRFEPAASGAPNRVMVAYKWDADSLDPMASTNPSLTTGKWSEPPVSEPENALLGNMTESQFPPGSTYPWVVTNASHWIYNGTSLQNGQAIGCVVGYEYDRVFNNGLTPSGLQALSTSPVTNFDLVPSVSNGTIYTAPSGALVFAAGTNYWPWKLDDNPYQTHGADVRVQQMTANLLQAMIDGAPGAAAAPRTSTVVGGVATKINSMEPPSPQQVGTRVALTATPSCGGGPDEFKWWLYHPNSDPVLLRDWGDAAYTWDTTGLTAGTYTVAVWARTIGSPAPYDNSDARWYQLTAAAPCTAVTLGARPPSPQALGTTVGIVSNATCSGTPEYKYWLSAPGSSTYTQVREWGDAAYTWNIATLAPGTYTWAVWVRNVGSPAVYEAVGFLTDQLSSIPTATATSTTTPTATLTASPTDTSRLTATPTGTTEPAAAPTGTSTPTATPRGTSPPTAIPTSTGAPTATATSTTNRCLLGDIDCDGIIDIRDYGIWRQNFGQQGAGIPADLDQNDIVDIRDYGIWRANFGHTSGAAARTATPAAAPRSGVATPTPIAGRAPGSGERGSVWGVIRKAAPALGITFPYEILLQVTEVFQ
jgi:hypothetical protein